MGTQLTAFEEIGQNLARMEGDFKSILPPDIDPKKFVAVALTAIQKNKDLLSADKQSLFNACRECASDGLLADGREAALVMFKNEVKYMPMAGGLIKKLNEAGVAVNAQIVYKNDKLDYWTDETGQHIKHTPILFADRGPMVGVYCIARYSDITHIETMSKEEVDAVRKTSRNPNGLMWTDFYDQGAKKTILRRAYKWLPKTLQLEKFIQRDDEANFEFNDQPAQVPPKTTSDRLKQAIDVQATPASEPPPPEPPKTLNGKPVVEVEFIEGLITSLKISDDKTRFGCFIDGTIYSTADTNIYRQMEEAADKHQLIRIGFAKKLGRNNTTIFEAMHLLVLPEKEK